MNTASRLSRGITLNVPILSAAMDTVVRQPFLIDFHDGETESRE
ncbi:MAG: hypothetical protein AAFN13_10130 [Bacteroidota bacterium]